MTLKRAILALLTTFAIARIAFSLNDSFSQPQIQSRLELYQTNLVLHVAEFKNNPDDEFDLNDAVSSLVGENPYSAASKQYNKVRTEIETTRNNFVEQLDKLNNDSTAENAAQKKQITSQISELEQFIDELDLKRGILTAAQEKPEEAISIWDSEINNSDRSSDKYVRTAELLKQLWQNKPQTSAAEAKSIITSNLDGWFCYAALAQLDRVSNLTQDLVALQKQEIITATQSVAKLAFISALPIFGGIFGTILLVFLIVQGLLKKEQSIIATNSNTSWETPWDWEITWQVLIVGFFFVAQIALPLLLGIFNLNPVNSSLRIKAVYVLGTYMAMAIGGISVLYLSIKSFLPFPQDWFKFKLTDNWIVWGFGGYLVALPAVLLVSLINQQIWQGQGGSNPLLFLALQAQDKVALIIFFVTSSIAAPIFEEIMFRGFLLPSLTRYVSVRSAILISAFIFAVAHLSLSEVLPLATLGIVLGVVYTRSRNLLAPMLLHSLWNSGTLISLFVLGSGT
ncbi:MAG: CPBP family glutamic-type intramembrane protease [Cyanobacteria bacterium P01_G01_bin.19]